MKLRGFLKPREWQQAALIEWEKCLRGIAHVVTGGGKTVFSYLCIGRFFENHPDGRVVIVVPTLALMDQWTVDIADSMTFDEEQISCFSGSEQTSKPNTVNIVVLNTARSISGWLMEGAATFLIVDECHRAATTENSKCLTHPYVATLGLSATPYREHDEGFEEYLAPYLGDVVYEYSYKHAHKDKVIVDFGLVNIDISVPEGKEHFDRSIKASNAVRKLKLRQVESSEVRSVKRFIRAARAAWAVKLAVKHRGERTVVFHERVDSLDSICRGLSAQGMTNIAYHSRMLSAHRRDNLRMFRRGESNVLVTCRALDEGTNVPESNIAIIAQSTTSIRQRIQRLGRVLRPAEGKQYATIYTLYDSSDQEELLREEEADLEGVAATSWKRGVFQ